MSEKIVEQLRDFVAETGKLPAPNEPDQEMLIKSAIREFGSLENALRVAGLLTEDTLPFSSPKIKSIPKKETTIRSPPPKIKDPASSYPEDYFLKLLGLIRHQRSGSPAADGTPNWWERKAKAKYACSICRNTIESGERYIGRKKLTPGQRGAYGYRGSYNTDYYHIDCLLKISAKETERDISNLISQIRNLESEINTFAGESADKKQQIANCQIVIIKVKTDYNQAQGIFNRSKKWFTSNLKCGSMNRQIARYTNRISVVEKREIPLRQNHISELQERKNHLQGKLDVLNSKIHELQ